MLAELYYSNLLKLDSKNEALYKGKDSYHGIDAPTRDNWGIAVNFTPTWYQVFPGVDLTVSLGRRDQRPQYGMTVFLDFGPGQQIRRLRDLLWRRRGLTALPGLIRLERHHPQRGQRRIIGAAGTTLRTAPATQRPTQRAAQATTGPAAE